MPRYLQRVFPKRGPPIIKELLFSEFQNSKMSKNFPKFYKVPLDYRMKQRLCYRLKASWSL